MMSGAWLEANTPTSLAMARPCRRGRSGGPHLSPEIRLGPSGRPKIDTQKIRGEPRRRAAVGLLLHEQEVLHVRGSAHRDHHSPSGLELVDQRLRDRCGRGGDDDGVEGRGGWPAAVAVADTQLDVPVPQLAENLFGATSEGLDDLYRIDLRPPLGQHRPPVTR